MKTNYLKLTIAVACTLSPLAAIHAQEAPPPAGQPGGGGRGPGGEDRGGGFPRRNPFMAIFDTNNDGVLDDKEIANATAALKKLDKDGDGKITQEELRAVMPGRGPGGPGGQGGNNEEEMVNNLIK